MPPGTFNVSDTPHFLHFSLNREQGNAYKFLYSVDFETSTKSEVAS